LLQQLVERTIDGAASVDLYLSADTGVLTDNRAAAIEM
jgi:hypothetical protein